MGPGEWGEERRDSLKIHWLRKSFLIAAVDQGGWRRKGEEGNKRRLALDPPLFQASSRHPCLPLIEMHRREYEEAAAGVNSSSASLPGLDGLSTASSRLVKLDKLNRVLAHRPWRVTKELIQVTKESS